MRSAFSFCLNLRSEDMLFVVCGHASSAVSTIIITTMPATIIIGTARLEGMDSGTTGLPCSLARTSRFSALKKILILLVHCPSLSSVTQHPWLAGSPIRYDCRLWKSIFVAHFSILSTIGEHFNNWIFSAGVNCIFLNLCQGSFQRCDRCVKK